MVKIVNLPFIGPVTSETASSSALGSGRTGGALHTQGALPKPDNVDKSVETSGFNSIFDEVSSGENALLEDEVLLASAFAADPQVAHESDVKNVNVSLSAHSLDAGFTQGSALIDTLPIVNLSTHVSQSEPVDILAEPVVAPTPLAEQEIPQTEWTASHWLHPQDSDSPLTLTAVVTPTVAESEAGPSALGIYQATAISDAAKAELSTLTTSINRTSTQSQLTYFSRFDAVAPAGQELVAQSNSARNITEPLGSDVSLEDPGIKAATEKVDTLAKTGKFTDDLAGLLLADSQRERATPVISKQGSDTIAAVQGLAAQSINHPSATYSTSSQADTAGLMAARTPMGTDAWGRDIGEKVLWMAAQNLTEAEIQLDPPELGPLQARISVQNDQAQVSFTSNSALVRDALDQTAHRLRDMFSSEGLNLVDVNVSDQQQHGRSDHGGEAVANNELATEAGNEAPAESLTSKQVLSSQFIVDQFV